MEEYVGTHRNPNDTRGQIEGALWDPRYVTALPMMGLMALGLGIWVLQIWFG